MDELSNTKYGKNYIVERSLCECLVVFVDNLKYYFENYQTEYQYMYDLLSYLVSLEP